MQHLTRSVLFLCLAAASFAQTGPLSIVGGVINFTAAPHTGVVHVAANVGALPATGCTIGELAIVSAATLGQQLYENSGSGACVWTQQLNTGTNPARTFVCRIGSATGTSVIGTGDTGCYSTAAGFAGTITRLDIIGNAAALATCSITVDIDKKAGAYPNTTTDKISASAPATLSAANVAANGSLSGWSLTVTAGDIFNANVATVTGCVYAYVVVTFQ